MMNLDGKWYLCNSKVVSGKNITIEKDKITLYCLTLKNRQSERITTKFTLKNADYLLCDAECMAFEFGELGEYVKPDLMCHKENIDGQEVVVLSYMLMEYDGRGLIVGASYVRENDLKYIPKEFESRLYKARNESTVSSMNRMGNDSPSTGMMGGMTSFMGMKPIMQMAPGFFQQPEPTTNSGFIKQPEPAMPANPTPTSWNCDCGQMNNTGKFCTNCGKKRPQ